MGACRGRWCWRFFRALAVFFCLNVSANAQVQVFVAASLAEVVGAIGQRFSADSGIEVRIVSAGSSTLAQQIGAGAPADIFVSANRDWVDYVQGKAAYSDAVELFSNRLVVISLGRSAMVLDDLKDLPHVLGYERLALGDPAHVPAGIYARQALQNVGVWEMIEARLAPALNVRGALRLVLSGAAPLGVVYATDIVGVDVAVQLKIAADLHAPIAYVMSLAPDAGADSLAFYGYLQGDRAKTIAFEYGYLALEKD